MRADAASVRGAATARGRPVDCVPGDAAAGTCGRRPRHHGSSRAGHDGLDAGGGLGNWERG